MHGGKHKCNNELYIIKQLNNDSGDTIINFNRNDEISPLHENTHPRRGSFLAGDHLY